MYLFKRIANKTVAERRPRLAAIPQEPSILERAALGHRPACLYSG
jgi:hypothetical protein